MPRKYGCLAQFVTVTDNDFVIGRVDQFGGLVRYGRGGDKDDPHKARGGEPGVGEP
jgi:hypothetical protein